MVYRSQKKSLFIFYEHFHEDFVIETSVFASCMSLNIGLVLRGLL